MIPVKRAKAINKIKTATKVLIKLKVTFLNKLFPINDPEMPDIIAKIATE
jgi:hypothetical protein